ncbi:aldehyde dehydrogenase family protein [Candidatus Fermentibacteria bacterium]|nr:aldehyde dehydrogenase family protein [Candidatus Fermentibacteria bacterium]
MALESYNPSTEERIASYSETSPERIEEMLEAAESAQREWAATGFGERAEVMGGAARLLRERASDLARLMATEMGKPLTEGRSEAEKCARVCDYYAGNAEAHLEDRPIPTDAARSYVTYRPLGVLLAVMPWNFPFWQVFRFLAPSLMAGNAALLKHSSNVTGCALRIGEIIRGAGFPEGLFDVLVLPSDKVSDVIADPRVRGVSLTGSTPAGISVGSSAGASLIPSVLELGGSDPYVILADADLRAAAETCAFSRLINAGQCCISAKRMIVERKVSFDFCDLLIERMAARTMGDPLEGGVDVGPMARADLREEIHGQVRRSVKMGASVALGCEMPGGRGWFYPPSVLTGVSKGMPAFDEETFGPVAAVLEAADEEECIRLANDTSFGLGAAVFTSDVEKGERIAADRLRAGCCFVNTFVRSDPRLPFGGIKGSGYGRELSREGILEFVNAKTVYRA